MMCSLSAFTPPENLLGLVGRAVKVEVPHASVLFFGRMTVYCQCHLLVVSVTQQIHNIVNLSDVSLVLSYSLSDLDGLFQFFSFHSSC